MIATHVRALGAALTFALAAPLAATAATLPAAPVPDRSFDAGSLGVQRFGHGDPVVLIPGLGSGPWEWSETIRHLAPSHTVYAVTLPGFDGRPAATAPLFARASADFWTLLAKEHIARPVVIGHSLGGTFAILLGEQHPERLRAIVAVEGLPIFPGLERVTPEQRAAAAEQAAGAMANAKTHEQFVDSEKKYMHTAGGVLDPDLADQAGELEAKSDPAAVAQWLREDLNSDLRPDLAKVTVPLLELAPYNAPDLAGAPVSYTEDQKVQYYRALLGGAPKLQVISISPARHFLMLDQPARFVAAVDAFLSQNP